MTGADYRALSAEEFDQHVRNGQPADYIFVGRLITTVKLQMQVERSARVLVRHQPGCYSYIEQSLGALDASREET